MKVNGREEGRQTYKTFHYGDCMMSSSHPNLHWTIYMYIHSNSHAVIPLRTDIPGAVHTYVLPGVSIISFCGSISSDSHAV